MTDKEKAERIVILLKTVKKLQMEIDKLFKEIGITSCNAGLRSSSLYKNCDSSYQIMDPGATKFAELLGVTANTRELAKYEGIVWADIGDGIAVIAVEEKKS